MDELKKYFKKKFYDYTIDEYTDICNEIILDIDNKKTKKWIYNKSRYDGTFSLLFKIDEKFLIRFWDDTIEYREKIANPKNKSKVKIIERTYRIDDGIIIYDYTDSENNIYLYKGKEIKFNNIKEIQILYREEKLKRILYEE